MEVEDGEPATGGDARATAVQLLWSDSAPNQVAPEVIHTNRQDPEPVVLSEYAARVTLPPLDASAPSPSPVGWLVAPGCAAPPCAEELATLTVPSCVDGPAVNFTEGSSNSSDCAVMLAYPLVVAAVCTADSAVSSVLSAEMS